MKLKNYIISILIPVFLGGLVGFFISGSIYYNVLTKPVSAPPGILFPFIWTILYILMGVSYGRCKNEHKISTEIDSIYFGQLIVNLIWPIIFFTLHFRLIAFFWIIYLDILIVKMIKAFCAQDKIAGLLQIPYLTWCIYATYLNLSIYLLN